MWYLVATTFWQCTEIFFAIWQHHFGWSKFQQWHLTAEYSCRLGCCNADRYLHLSLITYYCLMLHKLVVLSILLERKGNGKIKREEAKLRLSLIKKLKIRCCIYFCILFWQVILRGDAMLNICEQVVWLEVQIEIAIYPFNVDFTGDFYFDDWLHLALSLTNQIFLFVLKISLCWIFNINILCVAHIQCCIT